MQPEPKPVEIPAASTGRAAPVSEALSAFVVAASVVLVITNEFRAFRTASAWIQAASVLVLALPLFWLVLKKGVPKLRSLFGAEQNLRLNRALIAGTATLAGLVLLAFPVRAKLAVGLGQWVCLTVFMLATLPGLVGRKTRVKEVGPSEGLGYALLPILSWSALLWVFYPGLMSSDSADQWVQAGTGRLYDFHPIVHTFLLSLSRKVWDSPAGVVLVQVLAVGSLAGWALLELRRSGLSRTGAWVSSAVLAFLPVFSTSVITVWKDIPFGAAMLGVTTVLFRAAAGRALRWGHWILLVVLAALAWVVRHNGAPLLVGVVLALLLLLPKGQRRYALYAGAAACLLALGTRSLVVRAYEPPPFTKELALIGFLGSHVAHGTELSPDEAAILDDIHPLASKWNYDCSSNVPTVWSRDFDSAALARHAPSLRGMVLSLSLRNPVPVLSHLRCASSMLWEIHPRGKQVTVVPLHLEGEGGVSTMHDLPGGARQDFPSPVLARWVATPIVWSMGPGTQWLLWRPAFLTWLLVLGALLSRMRSGSFRLFVPLIPVAVHSAALAVFITAPDVRYQYGVMLVAATYGLGFLLGVTVGQKPQVHEEADPATSLSPGTGSHGDSTRAAGA